mgnify:CR=1 FL=1
MKHYIILILLLIRLSGQSLPFQEEIYTEKNVKHIFSLNYSDLKKNKLMIRNLSIENKKKLYEKFYINRYSNMLAGIIPFWGHCRIKKCTRVLGIFLIGSFVDTLLNTKSLGGNGVSTGISENDSYDEQQKDREALISLLIIADLYTQTDKYNQDLYTIIYN